MSYLEYELSRSVEYIKDRLYYVSLTTPPENSAYSNIHFICTDHSLLYNNFFLDFGPFNLGQVLRFVEFIQHTLNDPALKGKKIYYFSAKHPHKRTNSVFLMCAFGILSEGLTAEQAYEPFSKVYPPLSPFHDATPVACTYNLTVYDCLCGLYKAKQLNFFDFNKFDLEEYEKYDRVENGDLNWILQGKFLAFAGPHATKARTKYGFVTLTPEDYIPYFKRKGVTDVIRLNKKQYESGRFERGGMQHHTLYYLDGANPPMALLQKFIKICETAKGGIAVHCKAGLGRTGTCIGAYLMKHYKLTAKEVIGWLRLCRPGSVIGPQQQFLEEIQNIMWQEGDTHRNRTAVSIPAVSLPSAQSSPLVDSFSTDLTICVKTHGKVSTSERKNHVYTRLCTPSFGIRRGRSFSQGDQLVDAKLHRCGTPSGQRLSPLHHARRYSFGDQKGA